MKRKVEEGDDKEEDGEGGDEREEGDTGIASALLGFPCESWVQGANALRAKHGKGQWMCEKVRYKARTFAIL